MISTWCICRGIVANEVYRKKEILEKLDPVEVKEWNNYSQRLAFVNAFNDETFEMLPEELIDTLLDWHEIKSGWKPKIPVSLFKEYFYKLSPGCIYRGLTDNEGYRTEDVLEKLTIRQVEKWKLREKKIVLNLLKKEEKVGHLKQEVKIDLEK